MFMSILSTDTPTRVKQVLHESEPVSATCVSLDLKYLVQALTEVHSNKDCSSKAATKQSSTLWQIFYTRQGINDAKGEPLTIPAALYKTFAEVMAEKGALKVTLFNNNLAAALKQVKAKCLSVGSHVYNPPGIYDKVLIRLITDFEVMKDPNRAPSAKSYAYGGRK